MADGRSRRMWAHTSSVLCLLANIHRDTEKRRQPFHPDDWNPLADRPTPRPLTAEEEEQIAAFEKQLLKKQFKQLAGGERGG